MPDRDSEFGDGGQGTRDGGHEAFPDTPGAAALARAGLSRRLGRVAAARCGMGAV